MGIRNKIFSAFRDRSGGRNDYPTSGPVHDYGTQSLVLYQPYLLEKYQSRNGLELFRLAERSSGRQLGGGGGQNIQRMTLKKAVVKFGSAQLRCSNGYVIDN